MRQPLAAINRGQTVTGRSGKVVSLLVQLFVVEISCPPVEILLCETEAGWLEVVEELVSVKQC